MTWISEFLRRLRYRLGGAKFDQDLAEEMRLHMELRAADKQAEGMAPGTAQAAARRQFGNLTRLHEISREAWGWTLLDTLAQDVRYGVRALAANPVFTATAVLSLALGIGANTAIFSVINAVMLRSLPVEDPHQLVQVRIGTNGDLTNPIWEQIRDHRQVFSGVLAYASDRFDLADGGESRYAQGMWVSGEFFRVLGVPAIEGRVFTSEDDRHGGGSAGPVAVVSYGFWKRNFPAGESAVGKTVRLNRQSFEIVGVTPPWFRGLDVDRGYDVAVPIGCEPVLHAGSDMLENPATWWLSILGRLSPGTGIAQAEDRMRALAPEVFRATVPDFFGPESQAQYLKNSFSLRPAGTGFSETGDRYRSALFTLMATVGLVLLIACANIANLLLARAAARRREFSVRMAIGASRLRIVRQLMTESVLLSILGAGGGFLLAMWGGRLLLRLLSTTGNPLEIDLSPDLRLLAFTICVAILTALLFGLAPAFRATRAGLNHALAEHSLSGLQGARGFNLGKALVAGQVALCVVLLVGAGLFLGTLRNLLTVDPGFSRENVLLVSANLQQAGVPEAGRAGTYREILERLRAVPGVVSAASSFMTPVSNRGWTQQAAPAGYVPKSRRDAVMFLNRVSPGFFKTMGTPLLAGRDFSDRDDLKSPKVMIINQSAARHYFGSESPLGKTIWMGKPGTRSEKEGYELVGIVKDSKYARINEEARRIAYLASGQETEPATALGYEVRAAGRIDALIPAIRSSISEVNREISVEFRNFETQVNESLLQPRIVALLSTVFGSLALLLAMVGLYGITAYSVTRRRAEIGIRVALGAQRRAVIWLVLRSVVVLLAVGMSLGIAVSLAAGRLVTSLLFGVRANDPVQLASASLVLVAATALAAYLPARRAARLHPMEALREE